ncbi:hypothetical protein ACE10W_05195 [Bradyrhizobium sp. B025]|uniref:hypothetical protein n=1 Tax=Bradyrhizobium sp. B025 TaxID=3344829 RepID=UPI0035D42D06
MKLVLEREIEFREAGTVAIISVSETGGPIRQLITGREPHPTGRPVLVKAGFRAQPWESFRGELPFMELAEVASPVLQVMAQPHRLDMKVVGGPQPVLRFETDFLLTVDANFVADLQSGAPFWLAALRWRGDSESFEPRKLVVEAKTDDDPRNADPEYGHKVALAREVYGKIGWAFATVVGFRDLPSGEVSRGVHRIWLRALTKVSAADVAKVSDFIARAGVRSYAEVAEILGGGPVGRSKLAALHVRRVLRIDLTKGLFPSSAVSLLDDGGVIL